MIIIELKHSIHMAITCDKSLQDISTILKDFKKKGVLQSEVIDLLESMRGNLDGQYEDRVLEVLDIASGYCDSKYIVW